jgi:hypothetical protein
LAGSNNDDKNADADDVFMLDKIGGWKEKMQKKKMQKKLKM